VKHMSTVAWVCPAIYAIIAAGIYIPGRNATGERAAGLVIPFVMAPAIVLLAAAVAFAQSRRWTTALAVIAAWLALPILVVGPRIVGGLVTAYAKKRAQETRDR